MQTSVYKVAGVPLYDSAPILYLDDPMRLRLFIKKFDMVGTYRPHPAKYAHYALLTNELSKTPYLAFTAHLMGTMCRNVANNTLSNPDAECIVLDFTKLITDLRDRVTLEPDVIHGFVRWYRVGDCAILVIVRKLHVSHGLSMFVGISKQEAITNKIWDHFFTTMQTVGA